MGQTFWSSTLAGMILNGLLHINVTCYITHIRHSVDLAGRKPLNTADKGHILISSSCSILPYRTDDISLDCSQKEISPMSRSDRFGCRFASQPLQAPVSVITSLHRIHLK